jgi:hypothetical protein
VNKKNKKNSLYKKISIIVLVLLLIGGVFAGLKNFNSQKAKTATLSIGPPKPITDKTGNGPISKSNSQAPTPSVSTSTSTSTTTTKTTPPTATSSKLIYPYGIFVSNHTPSLSSSGGYPNIETSNCNTTPGADCYIQFTQGSITKTLPTKTTDISGATYWSQWSLQSLGLTGGHWVITAVVTLNNQTLTRQDPNGDLVISL